MKKKLKKKKKETLKCGNYNNIKKRCRGLFCGDIFKGILRLLSQAAKRRKAFLLINRYKVSE